MREIAYTWVTKSQASTIAKTFGCVKISDLCGKSAKLKLSYGNQIFPDVVGIMPSDNTLDIKSQPFPRWIKEWKSGKFVTNSMFF